MKKTLLGCALVALTGLIPVFAAENSPLQFQWRQRVVDDVARGMLYRIKVVPEIYDGSHVFPDDLRIFDNRTNQWPFVVRTPAVVSEPINVAVRLVNTSIVEQPERYLRQDVRVLPDPEHGGRMEHDQVIIRMPGHDFIRRVEILGSDDGSTWGRLGGGYLIDYSRDVHVANTSIRYSLSSFPQLQVRIYPNAKDATEALSIQSLLVTRSRTPAQTAALDEVPLHETEPGPDELRPGCQVLIRDTLARNRPIDELRITAQEPEYTRSVKVYGRNSPTNTWRWVADGEIHRFNGHLQETMAVRNCTYRYLKFEIYHYDDQPLRGVGVSARALPQYIVLEAKGDEHPVLYYGSHRMDPPNYDLSQRLTDEDVAKAPLVRVGTRQDNHKPTPSWVEKLASVSMLVAIGGVSLIVLWVIVRMLKRQTGAPD